MNRMRFPSSLLLAWLSGLLLVGCGGTQADPGAGAESPASVVVVPNPANTTTGGSVSFAATGTGTAAARTLSVTWSVTAGGGSIGSATGVYVAPGTPGTFVVTATSVADPTKSGTATVNVTAAPVTDFDRLRAIATKRIFFQHASVGGCAVGVYNPGSYSGSYGLRKTILDNPTAGVSFAANATTAAAIPVGTFGEQTVGNFNGNASAKLAQFRTWMQAGLGGAMDYVVIGVDYADLDQNGQIIGYGDQAAFFNNVWKPTLDALQAQYPTTTIIHMTAPLLGAPGYYGDGGLETWNARVRATYPSNITFDLGYWESVNAAGARAYVTNPNPAIDFGAPMTHPDWTVPGDGHPNQAGANWLGAKLLDFLATRH